MGPLPNLIYYASICTSSTTIVEYLDGDAEFPVMASKCLQLLPPYHSRLSNTANGRIFACIIDEPFLYSAIADEALSRSQVMSFLEQLQCEFTSYVAVSGKAHHSKWEPHCLDVIFDPIIRRLVSPFVVIPQTESDRISKEMLQKNKYADVDADMEAGLSRHIDYNSYNQAMPCETSSGSRSPSTPLISKTNSSKYKHKKYKDAAKDGSEMSTNSNGNPFEKVDNLKDTSSMKPQMQRIGSAKNFSKVQQVARRRWCKIVKYVAFLDFVVCVILFGVWLGICRGFSCVKEDSTS